MRRSSLPGILVVLALLADAVPGAAAEAAAMRYVYDAPESAADTRYQYQWKILQTALDLTSPEYGPYAMVPSRAMSESRQAYELARNTGSITVMYLSTTREFERALTPVRIPVDRNLGGYCVFLIRKQDQARFESVHSLDDLRQFTFGLGLGWIDVGILRASNFKVVTGSSYEGLFEMLANRRFDIFLRGAVEVIDEYERRRQSLPDLAIEPDIAFYYPLPMYFWFAKSAEGRQLAARAEKGMRMMIADGSYDRIFSEYQDQKIKRLNLRGRRLFRIENPNLGPETPFADKRLWFDPQTYRPAR
ncbi:MAG: hypothetical protein ABIP38_01085 [Steroidobacteraceae bacterium]